MKEELVSFETAKIAKEKGFAQNEDDYTKLTTVYELDGNLCNNGELKISSNFMNSKTPHGQYCIDDIYTSYFDMDNSLDEFILAPTQSLLAKWLREKHNIHINIWYNFLTDKWRIDCLHQFKNNEEYSNFDNEYLSYEEALEEGLKQALNLIKV